MEGKQVPLFDTDVGIDQDRIYHSKGYYSKKQKRAFHSVLSGLKLAKYACKSTKFLTLTTSNVCYQKDDYDPKVDLNKHFQQFKKRVERRTPYDLYKEGYITKSQLAKLYRKDGYFKKFKLPYFKVITNEGNGVIHLCYRGMYLPHSYVSQMWSDIHLSWNVNIQEVGKLKKWVKTKEGGWKKKKIKNMLYCAGYIVSQYMSGQGSSYVRSSMSNDWVFKGFKSRWYGIKKWYPDKCIEYWDNYLRKRARMGFTEQVPITDYG